MLIFAGQALANHWLRVEVIDSSGRPIPSARANVSNSAGITFASALADSDGRLALALPAPGRYLLKVVSVGFAERTTAVEAPGSLKLALSVNPIHEEITVTAESGQVQSSSTVAQRMTLLNENEIRERVTTTITEAATGEPDDDRAPTDLGTLVRARGGRAERCAPGRGCAQSVECGC